MKPGMMELLVVLAIIVIIFGPTQIPKLTKMIGKSIRNLREGMAEEDEDESKSKAKAKAKEKESPEEE